MNKVIAVVLLGAVAFYFLVGNEPRLIGSWQANGSKTVQSMIDGGKLDASANTDQKIVAAISDSTLIFTKNTMGISFKSDPSFKEPPIAYTTISADDLKVTISYRVKADQFNQDTYFFTEDGDCIYTKRNNYNDYFCKKT